MRLLEAAGIAYAQHRYDPALTDGQAGRRARAKSRPRLQNACHDGSVRRAFRLLRSREQNAAPEKSGEGGGRKKHRDAPAAGTARAHGLRSRRMLSRRHEKAFRDVLRRLRASRGNAYGQRRAARLSDRAPAGNAPQLRARTVRRPLRVKQKNVPAGACPRERFSFPARADAKPPRAGRRRFFSYTCSPQESGCPVHSSTPRQSSLVTLTFLRLFAMSDSGK